MVWFSFYLPLDILSIKKTSYSTPEEFPLFCLIFVLLWHLLITLRGLENQCYAVQIRYKMKNSCPVLKEQS